MFIALAASTLFTFVYGYVAARSKRAHNIEEAGSMAARIVILGANPGSIRGELKIDMLRPRDKKALRFVALVDYIFTVPAVLA